MQDDTCPSCSARGPLDAIEHEPWCPHFLRGLEGDAGQMTFGEALDAPAVEPYNSTSDPATGWPAWVPGEPRELAESTLTRVADELEAATVAELEEPRYVYAEPNPRPPRKRSTPSKRIVRCGLCDRPLPRTATGELEAAVVYSARTGAHYCPPRLEQSCRRIHDKQRRAVELAAKEG